MRKLTLIISVIIISICSLGQAIDTSNPIIKKFSADYIEKYKDEFEKYRTNKLNEEPIKITCLASCLPFLSEISSDTSQLELVPINVQISTQPYITPTEMNQYYIIFCDKKHLKNQIKITKSDFPNEVQFFNSRFDSVVIFDVGSDLEYDPFSIYLENDTFNSKLDFSYSHFENAEFVSINNIVLNDTLDFSHVRIDNGILKIQNVMNSFKNMCALKIEDADIDKIDLQYDNFKLVFPTSDKNVKIHTYKSLLARFNNLCYMDSYEKLDKEYKEYMYLSDNKWIINNLQKYWWDYGYNKGKIFVWTFRFFCFFLFFNHLFLPYWIKNVYTIDGLEGSYKTITMGKNWISRFFHRIKYSFFYTAIIFFGVKIDFSNLKYNDLLANKFKILGNLSLIYFFSMYLLGLICLGFITNWVFTY